LFVGLAVSSKPSSQPIWLNFTLKV